MSVLAEIVLKGGLQSEPAATLALAHILKADPEIARAFVRLLRPAGIEWTPGRIDAELGGEGGRPDLTIHENGGERLLFVENKFWAGLTDAQPVAYLDALPPGGALMFITPDPRVNTVWDALKARCLQAEREWETGDDGVFRWSRVGGKTLCITSWRHVLESLLFESPDKHKADILQLRGLTEKADSEAFLPIRAEELTDQAAVRRLVNYIDLVQTITDELKSEGIADKLGNLTDGRHFHARRARMLDSDMWFGIFYRAWRKTGITPMFWQVGADKSRFGKYLYGIRERFPAALSLKGHGGLFIPIHLRTGVEKEQIIEGVLEQTREMLQTLREQFPDEG